VTVPTLERRPTHRVVPLLRSEVSRLTHRRFARVMALILLGGIVLISVLVFVAHGRGGTSQEQLRQNQAEAQQSWLECAQTAPNPDRVKRFCGPEPQTQPLDSFDYDGDQRYKAYEALPLGLIGTAIAAAGVAFLVGASCGGAEWSSRSMTLQLLFEPRRLRLLAVKWLSLVGCAVALATVAMVTATALGALTAWMRGTWSSNYALSEEFRDGLGSTLLLMGLRGLVLAGVAATVGYAVAMMVRNTGASLGVAFVYFVVLENGARFAMLRMGYAAEPFMLSTNAVAFLFPGGLEVPGGATSPYEPAPNIALTNLRALGTLVGYTVLLVVPAAWSFTRRDVA
jgi:hypothetical protein